MSRTFEETIAFLRRRLAGELPGPSSQVRMAPLRDDRLERLRVEGRACREAGVLALLYPRSDEAYLLVTVRRDHLAEHAGQVSFPGGRRERDEPLLQTALRETQEEVGLNPREIEVLGALTPLYIPPSNFCVYPFVGFTKIEPDLIPHDDEVQRIVHIPLRRFLAPDDVVEEEWLVRGEPMRVRFFDVEGLRIWGATAMMISELAALFEESAESTS